MGVTVTLAQGQLGAAVQTKDGIFGLVCTGGIDGYVLDEPLVVYSFPDALSKGISEDGSPMLWRHIKEFYLEAGAGAKLYILPVTNTIDITELCDIDGTVSVNKLLEYANGEISILGVMIEDEVVYGSVPDRDYGINQAVTVALPLLSAMCETWATSNRPVRAIIGATSFSGNPEDLLDHTASNYPRVSMILADTERATQDTRAQVCMGLVLGRLAKLPVQRKLSRVKDGSLQMNRGWIGGIESYTPGNMEIADVIADFAYITWKKHIGKPGFYFSGDPTLTPTNSDYHFLARGRVVDKAHRLAYLVFIEEVDDEVKVSEDGKLDAAYCKTLEQSMVNTLTLAMTANGECSAVSCFIDPAQNILATNQLKVRIGVTPVGYSSEILIDLGFVNPAA
jgi:hypothetical protein